MLERGKMDRNVIEMIEIESLAPKEHLLRKIDQAADFTHLYETVEPLYCEDNGRLSIHYFSWQRKVFQALKEVYEVTFAEVPVMERSQPSEHIVAAMEVNGVRIQVYEGADGATLQAILQATKSC